jgi:2',3'-cyclic-nucleotide 2'-phosphodiesterase (5'-nucleotidase family)
MVVFYNSMKVDSVAIGNHEWDQNEYQLRIWMTNEKGRYFSKNNNLNDKNNNKNKLYLAANSNLKKNSSYNYNDTTTDLPNKIPYKFFNFLDGKIKLGVIGLTTLRTPETTAGFPKNKFSLEDYKKTLIKNSKELRNKGTTAIILVSRVGIQCDFSEDLVDEYFKLSSKNKDTNTIGDCKGK